MAISDAYLKYLDHFGTTDTVQTLAASPDRRDIVALRHDVDYDLDAALEMAFHEWRRGCRATYYVLDTAPYWSDPLLLEKCLQLQDFGHEVGLHLNALTKWSTGRINDVDSDIAATLGHLRKAGLKVSGVAAHGDAECYNRNFINYWCFRELRPDDPMAVEDGLTAEGVPPGTDARQVRYPPDHRIMRQDGRTFPLWSVSMARHQLAYHATHVPYDRYFTDSGGSWARSPDPLTESFQQGRHQVLFHPEYWQGPQRFYFFLSTARSGSLWLSRILDTATSAKGVHEFTLNHRFRDGELVGEKRTFNGFPQLQQSPDETRSLMIEARDFAEQTGKDWAEANVYLPHLMETLREVFPEATLVHLYRDPKNVVRSLMNRDWYDTPDDPVHPVPADSTGWNDLDQLGRICTYVREVNETLYETCSHALVFERMTEDADALHRDLINIGLAVYPRLSALCFQDHVNANRHYDFPAYDDWSDDDRRAYLTLCGKLATKLGYSADEKLPPAPKSRRARKIVTQRKNLIRVGTPPSSLIGRIISFFRPTSPANFKLATKNCEDISTKEEPGQTIRLTKTGNAYVLFGGPDWHQLADGSGWTVEPGGRVEGTLSVDIPDGMTASLFCLMYDKDGQLCDKRRLGTLGHQTDTPLSFRPRLTASRFNIALHMPNAPEDCHIRLNHFLLDAHSQRPK